MNIGSFSAVETTVNQSQPQLQAEKFEAGRLPAPSARGSVQPEKKVAPEEVLDKIKQLTEGGIYSVRFEMDKDVSMLVVKVFDSQTDELVRQYPAEEVLGTAKALKNFRGLLIDDTL